MKPHKLFVQERYGPTYRLHRWNEPPVLGPIKPRNLLDEGSAWNFIVRLRMGHADWLKILYEMDAITPNSHRSFHDCQRDVIRLVSGWRRKISFYQFDELTYDVNSTSNHYPIINISQGVAYHFVPTSILLLSDPNAEDVKFFQDHEWQQAQQFLDALTLTDDQLAKMISGLKLRSRSARTERNKCLLRALTRGDIVAVLVHENITPPKCRGSEDQPVEDRTSKPKPPTLGPHEEEGYVPPENPHSGLHNQEALAPDFETSVNSFKTTRQVDMRNLSPEDKVVSEALKAQGWNEDKVEQILKSGNNFTETSYKEKAKMYGFNTAGHARNLDNSAYLLDETGMAYVKKEYFKRDHWDKEGIKNYLALPCFNAASQIDVMEVTKPTAGIQSTIGKASELLRYDGTDGYTTGTIGKIMGGGGTQITLDTSALKVLPGK